MTGSHYPPIYRRSHFRRQCWTENWVKPRSRTDVWEMSIKSLSNWPILIHGSAEPGHLLKDFTFQHVKIVFITVPSRPYTSRREDSSALTELKYFILPRIPWMIWYNMSVAHWSDRWCCRKWHQEEQNVSSLCGKMLTGHITRRNHQEVAGPFALSSFQNKAAAVYQAWCAPELSQHSADEFVHSWGVWGADKLSVAEK
jgi:phospholipase/carboxylesterase